MTIQRAEFFQPFIFTLYISCFYNGWSSAYTKEAFFLTKALILLTYGRNAVMHYTNHACTLDEVNLYYKFTLIARLF